MISEDLSDLGYWNVLSGANFKTFHKNSVIDSAYVHIRDYILELHENSP